MLGAQGDQHMSSVQWSSLGLAVARVRQAASSNTLEFCELTLERSWRQLVSYRTRDDATRKCRQRRAAQL
jgi:hypothetical protein